MAEVTEDEHHHQFSVVFPLWYMQNDWIMQQHTNVWCAFFPSVITLVVHSQFFFFLLQKETTPNKKRFFYASLVLESTAFLTSYLIIDPPNSKISTKNFDKRTVTIHCNIVQFYSSAMKEMLIQFGHLYGPVFLFRSGNSQTKSWVCPSSDYNAVSNNHY